MRERSRRVWACGTLWKEALRSGGKTVRVNVRLIDGPTGFHVWANSYEDQLEDFFAVRNRIVMAVASQLQPALTAAEIERALDAGPNNLDAWTRLQRANAHVLFNRSARDLVGICANGPGARARRGICNAGAEDRSQQFVRSRQLCRHRDL